MSLNHSYEFCHVVMKNDTLLIEFTCQETFGGWCYVKSVFHWRSVPDTRNEIYAISVAIQIYTNTKTQKNTQSVYLTVILYNIVADRWTEMAEAL